ncbi:abscisic stress-ripening protein 2-like protein [Carex littledalei]|uniref:Abscisic stress-ripening protein 2-like protein n=1 Tax=Carex littledalei TaxID=544730 RepID=A0A833QQ79_9POAL|nr:abscisic stress-ripening protein 2-like protein [Carex littledalei]
MTRITNTWARLVGLLLPAAAYARHEKHEAEKDPEHAHRHKLEAKMAEAAVLASGGYALHEHYDKKEEHKEHHEKKHHFF